MKSLWHNTYCNPMRVGQLLAQDPLRSQAAQQGALAQPAQHPLTTAVGCSSKRSSDGARRWQPMQCAESHHLSTTFPTGFPSCFCVEMDANLTKTRRNRSAWPYPSGRICVGDKCTVSFREELVSVRFQSPGGDDARFTVIWLAQRSWSKNQPQFAAHHAAAPRIECQDQIGHT